MSPSSGQKNNLLVIRFKGINVTAHHVEPVPGYQTFGNKLLGCFFCICMKFASPKRKARKIEVLKNVSGYVMPGTMTLLLGPPGSGKSTLLKVIEGKLESNSNFTREGIVLYNNNLLTSNVAPKKPIAYIDEQRNVHLPLFTVRETLEFAQKMLHRQEGDRFTLDSLPPELQASENPYLECVLQSFGLKGIENRKVGTVSDGITDGERTRLTVAEVAMGTHSVVLYDHPNTGQDSLLTYDTLEMLRSMIHLQQASAVMAKPYVTPEVFYLYDHLILLSEGQVIFQGPPHAAENYFNALGYIRPSHIDIGTFVQDIAAGDGAGYLKHEAKKLSIDDLVRCYERSDHCRDVLRVVANHNVVNTFWTDISDSAVELSLRETDSGSDVLVAQSKELGQSNSIVAGDKITGVRTADGDVQYIGIDEESTQQEAVKVAGLLGKPAPQRSLSIQVERRLDEHGDDACRTKQFGKQDIWDWWLTTLVLVKRQAQFTIRLKRLIMLRLVQVTMIGLFIGTLFYQKGGKLNQADTGAVRSVGFVAMMHLLLINIVQLPVHIMVHRPVFYKQRAQHLFGVSSYIVAHGTVNLPQSFVEACIYTNCVYFFAGLSRESTGHYFQYWAVLFLIAYLGSWYMLLVSAVAPILEVATSLAGFLIALNLLFSGFPIVLSVMRPYWKWMLYITPTRWGTVIFSSTQIDNRYNVPCSSTPTIPFCLKYPTLSYGQAFLKFYRLEGGTRNLLIAYAVIVIGILAVALLSYLAYRKIEITVSRPLIPRENSVETTEASSWPADLEIAESGGVQEDLKWTSNLPVRPMSLSFLNLKFVVKDGVTHEDRVILNKVTGFAKPGTMLAVAGSLHSGKKTLLKCISGRAEAGKLEGDVLINGVNVEGLSFCRISGFVEKIEVHQRFLTVKETVEFNASLRLGRHVTSGDRDMHVKLVLELMELSKVSNQLVGSLKQSTGRFDEVSKKLAIAVELGGNPSLLFLEDPTYRLDSVAGRRILRLMQKVALGGRTVVSTLYHPSGEALGLFDNALILKLGGEQVYFGPIGRDSGQMLDYFGSVSPVQYTNANGSLSPLTHVLDVLGGGIKLRDPVTDFAVAYQASPLHKSNSEEMQRLLQERAESDSVGGDKYRYPASYRTQVTMVFLRNQRLLWRNVLYTFSRLAASIAAGVLMGTLFLQLDVEKVLQMTSASVLPYMQAILISGLISNNVILQLGTDTSVYRRENRTRMYAPILYPLSWAVAELPYLLLATLVFTAISNGMAGVGVQSLSVFLRYWMGLFLFSVVVTNFGILVTLLTNYPLLAVSLVSISTSVWVSASGVTVPRNYVRFYKWLYWIDPFQYLVNINTSLAFLCDTAKAACSSCRIANDPCAGGGCSCARLRDVESQLARLFGPVQSQAVPAVFVWSRLKTNRVIEPHRMAKDFMALCVMIALFLLLAVVAFRIRHGRGATPPVKPRQRRSASVKE